MQLRKEGESPEMTEYTQQFIDEQQELIDLYRQRETALRETIRMMVQHHEGHVAASHILGLVTGSMLVGAIWGFWLLLT